MTNILELLKNEKVEWKKLGDVGEIKMCKRILKSQTSENGEIPFYKIGTFGKQPDSFISKELFLQYKEKYSYPKPGEILLSASGTIGRTVIFNGEDAYFQDSNIVWLSHDENKILNKYLYYFYHNVEWNPANGGTIKRLYNYNLANIEIPVPSLETQEKIVDILDKFTNYVMELQSELQSRTKQYTYYRDRLLSEEYLTKVTKEMEEDRKVEIVSLGDIGKINMCKRILKSQTLSEGDIPFYKIGTFGKKADAYISRDLFEEYKEKYSYPKKGEILLSASGTIGRTIIFNGEDSYYQDSNIVWLSHDEDKILNSYLYYCYKIINWNPSTGGTIKRLYNYNLININIVVPPLHVQQHVVAILDKFDTLVNDIKEGLPKEIEQRQKQYEYWRSVLLTFK